MKHLITFVCIAVTLLMSACYPEPETLPLVDDLVVVTNYDEETNFSAYVTYAIPTDTIGYVSNNSNDTILVEGSQLNFPRPVLNAIRSQMEARGFVETGKTQDPDLGVNVVVVNDLNVFQSVVYPGYYGYPGYYYPGYYGYGGWYYPPYVNTYAYNTGVLVIEIVDLRNRNSNNEVKVIWTTFMGDLYSTVELLPQTLRAVEQAFVQSPYISK